MLRAYILIIVLASSYNHECLSANIRGYLPSYRTIYFVALMSMGFLALGQNTDGETQEPIKATLYYIYWATWLGNVYGFFDLTGGINDWVSNYVFANKAFGPEVTELRETLKKLKEMRREKYLLAAQLCSAAIKDIQSGNMKDIPEYCACLKQAIKYDKLLEEKEHNSSEQEKND
jgi:hypothetical protein